MTIQVLGFADCPNTPEFVRRVKEAAAQLGAGDVIYVDQETFAPDDLRRGYPSPTALVNNRDLFDMPAPTQPSMGCRMYEGGLPTVDEIAARLAATEAP